MRRYEIKYQSVNLREHPKEITALVVEPDKWSANTGVMLFTHGWGKNRFYDLDKIEYSCERFDLVCISVEYRHSGYEFNAASGDGYLCPYDTSFYQVFDVLNGLRTIMGIHPQINLERVFHFARSQGGHIALLGSIFAPNTFSALLLSSPITHLTSDIISWAGRDFTLSDLSVRNAIEHADRLTGRLFFDHGTDDSQVPHDEHTCTLVDKLQSLGVSPDVCYYEGGRHNLTPATTMFDAYVVMAEKALGNVKANNNDASSLFSGEVVEIPCAERTLRIDWSKPTNDVDLFSWK